MSAVSLQEALGLGSYRTAWAWLHKLRRAMVRPERDRLSGRVEVDETYLGGLEEGLCGRQICNKALIVVAAEEDGRATGRIRMRRIDIAESNRLPLCDRSTGCRFQNLGSCCFGSAPIRLDLSCCRFKNIHYVAVDRLRVGFPQGLKFP